MSLFTEFKYSWSLHLAASVRNKILGEDSLVVAREFWDVVDREFVARALKPQRYTFLHELIEYTFWAEEEYFVRKADWGESTEALAEELVAYEVPFLGISEVPEPEHKEDREYEYSQYLLGLVRDHVARRVAIEVFTLLFPDRELLLKLNEIVACTVSALEKRDFPKLLARDGVVRRCRYWPAWLKKAVFYRDNGRCPLCQKNLSGLLDVEQDISLDHIVPLNLGGTNDPTNIQLLCGDCNRRKSGSSALTSGSRQLFWDDV